MPLPSALAFAITSFPSLIRVPPLYELVPESVSAAVPALTIPRPPDNALLIVWSEMVSIRANAPSASVAPANAPVLTAVVKFAAV